MRIASNYILLRSSCLPRPSSHKCTCTTIRFSENFMLRSFPCHFPSIFFFLFMQCARVRVCIILFAIPYVYTAHLYPCSFVFLSHVPTHSICVCVCVLRYRLYSVVSIFCAYLRWMHTMESLCVTIYTTIYATCSYHQLLSLLLFA